MRVPTNRVIGLKPVEGESRSSLVFRARYHDPTIGRFLSRDPSAGLTTVPRSLNRYAPPWVMR